jgi:hypothetical protein
MVRLCAERHNIAGLNYSSLQMFSTLPLLKTIADGGGFQNRQRCRRELGCDQMMNLFSVTV